ncbi:Hypothetical predicted protein [Cloeon dipterum]|uniref:ETS domain-containing protein n=3 Tax=Cloeon dipterum TaxID=197152 RepID=A0A8S1DBK7_9INSE|nr:Hypothetical predicted protein [Cloeon dipterum]
MAPASRKSRARAANRHYRLMPPVECTSLINNGAGAPPLQAISPLEDHYMPFFGANPLEYSSAPFYIGRQSEVLLSSTMPPESPIQHHNLNMNYGSDSFPFSFDQNYQTSNDDFHPISFESQTSSIFKSSCDVLAEGKDMAMQSTANTKLIPISSLELDAAEYDKKPMVNSLWTRENIFNWFASYGIERSRVEELNFTSVDDLYRMMTNDIDLYASKLGVSSLELQKACDDLYGYNPHSSSFRQDAGHVFPAGNHEMMHEVKQESSSQLDYPWEQSYYKEEDLSTDGEAEEFEKQEKPQVQQAPRRTGKRGRPPSILTKAKRREKSHGKLWEFIRDLLKDPKYCPSLICWENHDDGVFRFVSSEKVAKLWGDKRKNTNMTYEKLSRAMRYYYKSQILLPVTHRRLVYKFGPNAVNWRCENPNFARLS